MTELEPETRTPALDLEPPAIVRCTRCGTESPRGTSQCTNPACRSLLPMNQAARTHGLSSRQPNEEKLADIRKECERVSDEVCDTLWRNRKPSMAEVVLVECLEEQVRIITTLTDYHDKHGVMTPRGRMRASVATLQQAISAYDRLLRRIEERRARDEAPDNARWSAFDLPDEDDE